MGPLCNPPQQPLGPILPLAVLPLDEVKRLAIVAALDRCEGDYQLAARLLCVGKTTLYHMARKYNYHPVIAQGEALMTFRHAAPSGAETLRAKARVRRLSSY